MFSIQILVTLIHSVEQSALYFYCSTKYSNQETLLCLGEVNSPGPLNLANEYSIRISMTFPKTVPLIFHVAHMTSPSLVLGSVLKLQNLYPLHIQTFPKIPSKKSNTKLFVDSSKFKRDSRKSVEFSNISKLEEISPNLKTNFPTSS